MAGNQGNYREKTTRNEKKYKKANGQPRLKEKSSRAKSDNACPYAKKCGGCDYQGIEYKEQLKTAKAFLLCGADCRHEKSALLSSQGSCSL